MKATYLSEYKVNLFKQPIKLHKNSIVMYMLPKLFRNACLIKEIYFIHNDNLFYQSILW